MTPTHLVNQLKSGLVLLALVHQFDVHRGEGRGGGGQDDRGRGGDGGSLCASEMCVHAARSTARVDDHTSRLASRTVRRRRRRESEFEFDGCGRPPAISIDRPIRDRGDLELDERWATRREVARRARVDRIGVNRPLRSVVGRGSGRRARRATGRHSSSRVSRGGLAYPRAIESFERHRGRARRVPCSPPRRGRSWRPSWTSRRPFGR